jgi:hypothetical protein
MSLTLATWLMAIALLIPGLMLVWNGEPVRRQSLAFLRSKRAAIIVFGAAALGFLWHVAHLGEADFGNYRHYLLLFFGLVALLAYRVTPDFLPVRGAAILILLAAAQLLDAAYMQPQSGRLVLVTLVYAGILVALFLGTVPYRLRDFMVWLYANPQRPRALGAGFTLAAVALIGASFTY